MARLATGRSGTREERPATRRDGAVSQAREAKRYGRGSGGRVPWAIPPPFPPGGGPRMWAPPDCAGRR